MSRNVAVITSVVIALHGLIHLMGAAAYLRIADVQGLPYKTVVFFGRLNLGEAGTTVFGAAWVVAFVGFAVSAVGLFLRRPWWRVVLTGTALFSLILTVLDASVAFAGVLVNLLILVTLLIDSRRDTTWLSPRNTPRK